MTPNSFHMSRVMGKKRIAYAKTKTQISFAVTAKLISAFVFTTWIVQYLYFLNAKFPASSHLQLLYSIVCVRPGPKPHCWFSHNAGSYKILQGLIGYLLSAIKHGSPNHCLPDVTLIWAATWENQQCGFWPGLTQIRLYSHWRSLGRLKFVI